MFFVALILRLIKHIPLNRRLRVYDDQTREPKSMKKYTLPYAQYKLLDMIKTLRFQPFVINQHKAAFLW